MLKLEMSLLARTEARKARNFYLAHGGATIADGFKAEFLAACRFLTRNPDAGSSRFAHLLPSVELRTWSLNRYPFRIFYVHDGATLRVLVVEHEHRDVTQTKLARLKREAASRH